MKLIIWRINWKKSSISFTSNILTTKKMLFWDLKAFLLGKQQQQRKNPTPNILASYTESLRGFSRRKKKGREAAKRTRETGKSCDLPNSSLGPRLSPPTPAFRWPLTKTHSNLFHLSVISHNPYSDYCLFSNLLIVIFVRFYLIPNVGDLIKDLSANLLMLVLSLKRDNQYEKYKNLKMINTWRQTTSAMWNQKVTPTFPGLQPASCALCDVFVHSRKSPSS